MIYSTQRMTRMMVAAILSGAALAPVCSYSKKKEPQDPSLIVYAQKKTPQELDTYQFSSYYFNGRNAYNAKGAKIATVGNPIRQMRVNPDGTTFAILDVNKKGKATITVWDLWKTRKKVATLTKLKKQKALSKELEGATAIAYSPDGKQLYVSLPGKIQILNTSDWQPAGSYLVNGSMPDRLVPSGNGYYLAGIEGKNVYVWSAEDGTLRRYFEYDYPVESVSFSNGNDTFGVMTSGGELNLYDTVTFLTLGSIDGLGLGREFSFNPDDKYVSSVSGESRISVVNRMDDSDRRYIDSEQSGIRNARFVKDNLGRTYLVFQTDRSIVYKLMDELAPNLNKLLHDELDLMMAEWEKQMPGETLDEYNIRMSEANRLNQMRLFETEIATRMADNLIGMSQVTLGDYNPESQMLSLSFDKMAPIYLTVPQDELLSFNNPDDLEFRNAKYGLTPDDKFDLVYAEVYNKKSGKSYIFDNMKRESLEFLKEEENFMPLELAQQSVMQELQLMELNKSMYEDAKKQNIISDHTHLEVSSKIVPSTDATGNKIMNYQVNFAYEVEPGFSAKEDFSPGQYVASQSPAASSMLGVIKKALETDFSSYVQPGKEVLVKITGMADAMPIRRAIPYNGVYGELVDVPVSINGEPSTLTVTRKQGIANNEQLALVRATGVKEFIEKNVSQLDRMKADYSYNLEVAKDDKDKGGAYRRIKVEFLFVDAIK